MIMVCEKESKKELFITINIKQLTTNNEIIYLSIENPNKKYIPEKFHSQHMFNTDKKKPTYMYYALGERSENQKKKQFLFPSLG